MKHIENSISFGSISFGSISFGSISFSRFSFGGIPSGGISFSGRLARVITASCVVVLVLAGWLLWGRGAEDSCQSLLAAGEYVSAAETCEAKFETAADAAAGWAAMQAQWSMGRLDAVVAWPPRLADTPHHADALRLASTVFRQRGDIDAARSALRHALVLGGVELDGEAESNIWLAWTLYSLAHLDWEQARYRQALALAQESSEVARRQGDRRQQRKAVELEQGVLTAVGDLAGAREAQDRREALLDGEDAVERAFALAQSGDLWLNSGRLALARDFTTRALTAAAEAQEDAGTAFHRSAHLNLVEIALRGDDFDIARRHLTLAWKQIDPEAGVPTSLLYFRARLALREARWDAAAGDLEAALAGSPTVGWAWRLWWLMGRVEEAQGRDGAAEEAYRASISDVEEMRRALALETLKPWLLEKQRAPFEYLFVLLARQGRFDEALAAAERARARTFLDAFVRNYDRSGVMDHESPTVIQPQAAMQRLRSLETLLPVVSPGPDHAPRAPALLRQALRSRFVLSYFEANDQLWLLAGEAAGPWRRLARPASQIAADVDVFLTRPGDADLARRLAVELLPELDLVPRGETIFIVTDGSLGRLPFAALRLDERFLVQKHPLAYVPSLEALAALLERPRNAGHAALVLGDPLGDLPSARLEAAEVAALFATEPQLGAAASHELLIENPRPRVLHLATHTGLGPRGPWIALAGGELAADALVRDRVVPQLAVLATCASAARPGREMWGALGTVFLAAGSETVVASLFSVPDEAARALALAFYRHGGVEEPALALARAQRELLAQGRPPDEWAPFVVLGLADSVHPIPGEKP